MALLEGEWAGVWGWTKGEVQRWGERGFDEGDVPAVVMEYGPMIGRAFFVSRSSPGSMIRVDVSPGETP